MSRRDKDPDLTAAKANRCPGKKRLFRIEYLHPETGVTVRVEREFYDTDTLTGLEWARDAGYMLADKGQCHIEELQP